MREKIVSLIGEYQETIALLEQDRSEEKYMSISNAFRTAKIGAYQKVVDDLMMILEGEAE